MCFAILELEFEARSPSIGSCRLLVSDFSILGFGLFVCLFFLFFLRIREFDLLIDVGLFFPWWACSITFFFCWLESRTNIFYFILFEGVPNFF